jgi:mRNA interferase MazF
MELKAAVMKVFVHEKSVSISVDLSEEPPPKVQPRVKGAPKIRQLYWCDFPKDAHLPEFWKCRAVVVISFRNTLHGTVTVIPCSSLDQVGNKWAYRQKTTIDGRANSWAICDKVTTVAVSRLSPDKNGIKRVPEAEFDEMLSLLSEWLPQVGG